MLYFCIKRLFSPRRSTGDFLGEEAVLSSLSTPNATHAAAAVVEAPSISRNPMSTHEV